MRTRYLMTLGALAAVLLAGCGSGDTTAANPPRSVPAALTRDAKNFRPNAEAGISVDPLADPLANKRVAMATSYSVRNDPFALTQPERSYETNQTGARVFQDTGAFSTMFTPRSEITVEPVVEQQPFRRLAGVLVGDSVLAIIEMGDGQPPYIIRPGQKIPNSEWTVVSIDEDKAVLRRKGNKLPHVIIVPLESPPAGMGGSGAGASAGGSARGGPKGPPGAGDGGMTPSGAGLGSAGGG